MTIFVNPTQFGAGEDFADYPRTLDEDRSSLERSAPVDALFVPDEHEIYPFGTEDAVRLVMPALSRELCGARRPGGSRGRRNRVPRAPVEPVLSAIEGQYARGGAPRE